VIDQQRQKLLNEYAATCRVFSDAVDRLRFLNTDVERFIRALAETGTAHRACERSRLTLKKHLAKASEVPIGLGAAGTALSMRSPI
jgi:hypothetical protein